MKNLFIVLWILLSVNLFAQNRVMDATDSANYQARNQTDFPVRVGDCLLVKESSSNSDGQFINISNFATLYSGHRTNPTIWIDADSLDEVYEMRVNNNSSQITQTFTVRPIGSSNFKVARKASSNNVLCFSWDDFQTLIIDGETNTYPGYRDGIVMFPHMDKFGIMTTDAPLYEYESGGAFMSSGGRGIDSLVVRGCYFENGFAAMRWFGGTGSTYHAIHIERNFMGYGLVGEGMYFGLTSGSPVPKLHNLIIRNNIIAFRAAENFQFQFVSNGDVRSVNENNIYFMDAMRRDDPFEDFQNHGTQYVMHSGNYIERNNIIHGWGNMGINYFGSAESLAELPDTAIFRNSLYYGGENAFMYISSSHTNGVKHWFDRLEVGGFTNSFEDVYDVNDLTDYLISDLNGSTDTMYFSGVKYNPNDKADFFEDSNGLFYSNLKQDSIYYPQYVKSGFYDEMTIDNFGIWTDSIGVPGQVLTNTQPDYDSGFVAIVIESTLALKTGNTEMQSDTSYYSFWYCYADHTAVPGTYPIDDPDHWWLISWDEDGDPNFGPDSVDYDGHYSYFPPLDLRLRADTYHHSKGRGPSSNPQSDSYTQKRWYYASDTTNVSTYKEVVWARDKKFRPSDWSFLIPGTHYWRGAVRGVSSSGRPSKWTYTYFQELE